ncbi:MAG: hypothetical protein KTR16_14090 [Acidiferrobacterales bacterium]|nr:hypothetical protein [Acidiferrobacterales bacterium]
MKILIASILLLLTTTVLAHHGSAGQFNHDIKVELTGVITNFRLVNPHAYVYFDVVGDNGEIEAWRCEMRAASRLRSQGWTQEMFAPGTTIFIEGSQARREKFGCFTAYVTIGDGRRLERAEKIASIEAPPVTAVELAPGTPIIRGRWQSTVERSFTPSDAEVAAAAAAWVGDNPPAPSGLPSYESYTLTALGKSASEGFSDEVNPRFHCQASNIFHDWTFNQAINQIEQTDDKIIIKYGFMDIVRTIHMDMDEHPDNIIPSRAGHSIGRWEGDTLVVDTIGFTEGWLYIGGGLGNINGVKHSDQMHTVERFDVSDDGAWLVMTYTVNDPLHLMEPSVSQLVQRKSLEPFVKYICEDLTEEVVEGF